MSKKIFINNLNTYVSKQLFDSLRNDEPNEEGEANPDANVIFGTYIDKDSSEKPTGVKKMLKEAAKTQDAAKVEAVLKASAGQDSDDDEGMQIP